jgi:hypothetical protein
MNFRQLAYGIASYLPVPGQVLTPPTGGSDSAEYCYGVWLRHLVLASASGMKALPQVVAELGPGDSIGVGLAALISGASRYLAFDAVAHAFASRNLAVFDGLVRLFNERASIPGPSAFPELKPSLQDYSFPAQVLPEEHLRWALSAERIGALRTQLAEDRRGQADACIAYQAPWTSVSAQDCGKVDFILSQAVMEHVEGIDEAYRAVHAWLRPGGFAAHQIDFRSHGLFSGWDGHWACPEWLWALMQGRRSYLLNRLPYSAHRNSIAAAGFELIVESRVRTAPVAKKIDRKFSFMSDADRQTSGCYLLLRKPPVST